MRGLRVGVGFVDLDRGVVVHGDDVVALTSMETRLLAYLAARPDRVVAREELLVEVWGYRAQVVTRAVDVAVRRLRTKIEIEPSSPAHLLTEHGVGYRLAAAPWVGTERGRRHLPPLEGAFVGRVELAARVRDALATGRPVTLVGPGGIGKSRLAAQIAWDQASAAWCALADARTEADLLSACSDALGAPLRPDDRLPPAERLRTAFGREPGRLLVFDDAEAVRDALGPLAASLGANVLVTSRAPLGWPGELIVRVGPLDQESANALFSDRRAALGEESPLDADDVALVAALEGHPLAIVLAASKSLLLSSRTLRERLDSRLDWLTANERVGRHASLRAVVQATWDWLGADEQRVAAAASVFAAPFDVEALEEIVGEPILDAVEALVDASVLSALPGPGEPRLRIDEAVRQRAAEVLSQSPERIGVESRFVERYRRLATGLSARLRTREAPAALDRLSLDRSHFTAALARTRDADAAFALAAAVHALAVLRGPAPCGKEALDRALSLPGGATARRAALELAGIDPIRHLPDPSDTARRIADARARAAGDVEVTALADLRDAELAYRTGDLRRAGDLAAAAAVALDGSAGRDVDALSLHARALHRLGDDVAAEQVFTEALRRAVARGDHHGEATVRLYGAYLDERRGLRESAAERLKGALFAYEQSGDAPGAAWAQACLGGVLLDLGRTDEARAALEAGAAGARALGDGFVEGSALTNLGNLHLDRGDLDRAREALGLASARLQDQAAPADLAVALANRAVVDRDPVVVRAALATARSLGATTLVALCLGWASAFAAQRGDPDADALLAEAQSVLEQHPNQGAAATIAVLSGVRDAARAALARREGRSLDAARARARAQAALPESGRVHPVDVRIAASFLLEMLRSTDDVALAG
jgi:predicted ATPase/DNA-binding winged helix-turn-helix (wHTH) protein/Tfp pilus assembly protein PilF